jgi:hypothetical protein
VHTGDTLAKKSNDIGLTKSKERVRRHGEVFTPEWLVRDMLDLVKTECERVDSRFLEPSCGSGNFLVEILERKLSTVEQTYNNTFDKEHYALVALMSLYGVELLEDNVLQCKQNLLQTFSKYVENGVARSAAVNVLNINIIHGDTLCFKTNTGAPIVFAEWVYNGEGKFFRKDFVFEHLTQLQSVKGSLFDMLEEKDVFQPVKVYQPVTVEEISQYEI